MDKGVRRLLRDLGADPGPRILEVLKRRGGDTVSAVSRELGLSYMTARNHCVAMKKRGLLQTWRKPQPTGRPEILYRLTERAESLFSTDFETEFLDLLESSKVLYGPSAPEKLLYALYEKRQTAYAAQIEGDVLAARMESLARVRDEEGCMSEVTRHPVGGEPAICESHNPHARLASAYPLIDRLDAELFSQLLGVNVRLERDETVRNGPRWFICEESA